jgi:hypothetical protein
MDPSASTENENIVDIIHKPLWDENDTLDYCKICVFVQCSTILWRSEKYCMKCLLKETDKERKHFLEEVVNFSLEETDNILP